MTEKRYKRHLSFVLDTEAVDGLDRLMTIREVIPRLNALHEENKELQNTIETICKDFEESHGMNIRNADWFTAW